MDNGLTVLLQPDPSTALVAVCVLYKVGSRDEQDTKTGIAHLFEHLMFSNNGPGIDFDSILQNAGGECNAFTTTDTTQYYSVAPSNQLELLLALESNRISGFHVSQKDFKTQQRVVIEEFSEMYLNNPYGDFNHILMQMAYKTHPYRWPVIGFDQQQLKNLKLEDAEQFYHTFYTPSNAVLVIHGNFNVDETKKMIQTYFGKINAGISLSRYYPAEEKILAHRTKTIMKEMPEEGFYLAFPYCGRMDPDFYAVDFMTDILSEGKSSLLYKKLRKELMICSGIDCYITATTDPGLILVEGKLNPGHSIEEAEAVFWNILEEIQTKELDDRTWEKYMNKNESAYLFSQMGAINQALNLSYAEWLGNPELIHTELENYLNLTKSNIQTAAKNYFSKEHSCSLYYRFEK
ncbi:MAG: insulinase family protein [Saprospiraceae bacterium]|nr:insulinase family protein [Saprospiraceae bacterium]HRG68681.1 pitrilysin family protein [Saprospiraceae bacterium]